jgi:hypothetical protein
MGAVAAAAVCLMPGARAQLAVGLWSDRSVYVTYEPITVVISLRNYTGNALVFGPGPRTGHVRLFVRRVDGLDMQVADVTDQLDEMVLAPGATRDVEAPVNHCFDLSAQAEYEFYAQVGHPRLAHDLRSGTMRLHVREGTPVWRRRIGVPARGGGEAIPERDIVIVALHDGGTSIYCLRIEDETHVYGTVRLGRRIQGAEPAADVDAVSNIHVLLRVRSRVYSYQVYDVHGRRKQEKLIAIDDGSPQLVRDPETGRIGVAGGRPAVEGVDFVRIPDRPRRP